MSQLERIYKLDRMLRRRQPPKKREVLEAFEISPAQLKRDLEFIRDRLGVPITFNAETGAYQAGSSVFRLHLLPRELTRQAQCTCTWAIQGPTWRQTNGTRVDRQATRGLLRGGGTHPAHMAFGQNPVSEV